MRTLHADDPVVTPSGERGQVLNVTEEGFCGLRYLTGPMKGEETIVHERLLVLVRPGRGMPPPVRIGADGKRKT